MDQLTAEDPRFIGPYRLIARLGAGGMGLVYLGRSEQGRTVAVKVVQAEYAGHPEFRRRFAREVAAARRVGGSWTAAVLDADPEAAVPWVATQYIPGPDLHSVVAKDFGPLPEHSMRVLANRLALALQAVHGAGLIHRDLKPSNVLVTVDGPRVIDFGIARAMDGLLGDTLHTHTGMLIGSPGFMSPEQVRGAELTPASDVFCLGAVLVYASTGRLLFGAAETGLNAHLFRVAEEEADLTGVPEALVALVRSCLHKVPAERPGLQQIADQTTTDRTEEWLPSPVLAQLGRHAAELLDFAPATEEAPAAGPPTHPPTTPVVSATPPAGPPTPADAAPAATGPATAAPATAAPTDAASPTPGGAVGFGPPLYPHPGGWVAPASAGALREAAPARSNRWWGLAAVVLAQLLVGLQAGAFTIELPAVQVDLHLAFGDRSLLVTIYTLTFVALVVIAGHAADLVGRKRTLVAGLAGFAAASLLGGTAADAAVLILARGLQGCSAALVTAAALALVIAEFTDPRERRIALGVYAAIAGGGSALGLFAGGNIAELLSWRMSLLAGVPLAAIALVSTLVLPRDAARGGTARFDLIGALLGTVGLAAVTYGLVRAASNGWGDVGAVLLLVAGTPVFVAFLSWQSRTRPLPSSRVAMDRDRLAACFALVLTGTGAFALYTALSFYAQTDLGFSPTGTGTAFLPFAIALLAGSVLVSTGWASRVPIRARITVGLVLAALGLALLTDPSAGAGYTTQVLPGLALTGFGAGVALMPLIAAAVSGIAPDRAGAASATVAASLQLGAGLGSALFITRLLHLSGPVDSFRAAARADYTATLWWAAGGLVLAALAAGVLVTARPDDPR